MYNFTIIIIAAIYISFRNAVINKTLEGKPSQLVELKFSQKTPCMVAGPVRFYYENVFVMTFIIKLLLN